MCGLCTHSAVVSDAEKTAVRLTTQPPGRHSQIAMNDVISGRAHVHRIETLPLEARRRTANTNQHVQKYV